MKTFKNIKKSGLTIIETILALSIASVVIINVILFISEQTYKERMKISAGNIMTINSGLMRRVQHDGSDFGRFVDSDQDVTPDIVAGTNATSIDGDFIFWDEDDYLTGLLNNVLVPVDACNIGTWTPKDSSAGSVIRENPLIPCGLYVDEAPFGLEFRGALVRDFNDVNYDGGLARFVTFINYDNSDIYTQSGGLFSGNTDTNASRIMEFMNYLEGRQSADLYGTQFVELGEVVDYDQGAYVARDPDYCFLQANNCEIIVSVNFSGGNNQQFLRTDGQNAMLRPVKFSISGADSRAGDYQTCARWTYEAGAWRQDLVECGIHGGLGNSVEKAGSQQGGADGFPDEGGVKGVFSQTNTEGLFVTYRDPARTESEEGVDISTTMSLCELYTVDTTSDFIDNIGAPVEVPCGIYNVQDDPALDPIIQVVADSQTIDTLFADNIKVVDVAARRVRIKQVAAGDPVFTILDVNDNTIYNVQDDGFGNFTFIADGDYNISGSVDVGQNLTVGGNTVLNGNLDVIGERVSFNLSDRFSILFNTGLAADFSSINYANTYVAGGASVDYLNLEVFNRLRVGAESVVIDASDTIVLSAPETYIDDGGTLIAPEKTSTYSVNSHFDNTDLTYDTSLSQEERELRSFVTRDYVKHLDNIKSNIVLRYVNVMTPENSFLPKPDCLDFVNSDAENQELYAGSAAASDTGTDLARIILVPISFKTYSNSYGSNQFFTHHAQDAGTGWEVYFYISGDGAAGTGAREDGAGTSLAMVFCDYTVTSFN